MTHARIPACLLALLLGVAGCSETTAPDLRPGDSAAGTGLALALGSMGGEPLVVPLAARAGRLEVGTVSVSNDAVELRVVMQTSEPWAMAVTNIEITAGRDEFPLGRRGRPQLRKFEHHATHQPPVTILEYAVPLAEAGVTIGETVFLCAHARAVWLDGQGRARRKVDAWGDGESLSGRGRAEVFSYVIQPAGVGQACRLTLLWPNGGESICEGSSALVTWESSGECADAVRVELLRGGLLCQLLAEAAPNTGSFLWEDVQRSDWETDGYTLRVSAAEGEGGDASDAPFSIDQCGGPE